MMRTILFGLSLLVSTGLSITVGFADGLADNVPSKVRRIPRLGIELSAEVERNLQLALDTLKKDLDTLRATKDPQIHALLPDIEIYYFAVDYALRYREFFHAREITAALELIEEGRKRSRQLEAGAAPWTEQTGLVVRGYRSGIDASIQPYGLVIPESYNARSAHRHRLDLWFHGRGETLSEVNLLTQRRRQIGQFAPRDTIVLHPYGRYSNAFKFAGEIDVLEALASVQSRYPIDAERISVRGFSMGGAACWQFAVHYADRWFAANPGAGFSETPEFLKFFQKETLQPTWYERKLWHMYDCTDWAANLYHLPTVAYSGELDIQKQAADIMSTAMEREGLDLTHVIGPGTKHSYHPDAKRIVESKMSALARRGRRHSPRRIRFVTYTLRYDRMHWVRVRGLGEHWKRATVDAVAGNRLVTITTSNITHLDLEMEPGRNLFELDRTVYIRIDGQELEGPRPKSDDSWSVKLSKQDGKWKLGATVARGPRKKHGLQGPIDDAFMDSFIFVRPTGKSKHAKFASWVRREMEHARVHWRRHFRGEARIKDDVNITDDEILNSNLVLWGDPRSNIILGRIAGDLPIRWSDEGIAIGKKSFASDRHALILVHPNPLSPNRYVVLNSGFTFREFAYLNNARQVSKLPDWAVVDLDTPPDSLWPGKIVAADFFNESWGLRTAVR